MFRSKQGAIMLGMAVCLAVTACTPSASLRDTAVEDTSTRIDATRSASRTPIQAAWWQRFNDPLLTSLIQEALQANPDIKTAQASLRSARAQRAIAGASLLPGLSAGATVRNGDNGESYGLSMDASWEVDIFGTNRLASSAAAADVKASQASLEDVKASLAAEVASDYVNLRLAQARLGLSRQTLASRAETARLIGLKQQAGLASGLEVEQANLSQGQSEAQIPDMENTIAQSQHALATLTGKAPEALDGRLSGAGRIPAVALQLADNIPANAIRQRPDIRAAEYKVQAASLRIGEAKANRYPSLNLGGTLSYNSPSLATLLDPASIARSLLASISAPLFDGGKLKQQVEVSSASHDQAVAAYQKAVLGALQDVANAFSSLRSLNQQQPILVKNVGLAQSAEKLAQLSFDAGTVDFQNVLDAQRNLLGAQESQLAAQAATAQAVISLYKAVGGAW